MNLLNKPSTIYIAPEAVSIIAMLPRSLREKVKNALLEISRNSELSTELRSPSLRRLLKRRSGAWSDGTERSVRRRLYKAGRFKIIYRRDNGAVWIDALALDSVLPVDSKNIKREEGVS